MKNASIVITANGKELSYLQEVNGAASFMKTTGNKKEMLGTIDVTKCTSLVASVKKRKDKMIIVIDLLEA